MTPPPSASANYDAGYQYAPEDIHAMMAEVTALAIGIGAILLDLD